MNAGFRTLMVGVMATLPSLLGADYETGLRAFRNRDFNKALLELAPLAAGGDPNAQMMLGQLFFYGWGVDQNSDVAFSLFLRAAAQGSKEAQTFVGHCYELGKGTAKDEKLAFHWTCLAASGSDAPLVQFNCAEKHYWGFGTRRDAQKAVTYYRLAAEKGLPRAQFKMGMRYAKGEGVPRSAEESTRWFRKAAEGGDLDSSYNFGIALLRGEGIERNPAQAALWFRKSAERGHVASVVGLARMLAGWREGIEVNQVEAANWALLAAEAGSREAQNMMGTLYQHGQGVPRDYERAVYWYRLAAEQGEPLAQSNLGYMYGEGLGVERSEELAAKLYTYSAMQGSGIGQANLAETYEEGRGVESDLALAYFWYETALRSGWKDAGEGRNRMAKSLSPNDLRRAQQLVKEWKPRTAVREVRSEDLDAAPLGLTSTGTAFRVSSAGHLLTNKHVVEGCAPTWVSNETGREQVLTIAEDGGSDLGLLGRTKLTKSELTMSPTSAELGEQVLVAGYPLHGLLSASLNVSSGLVSSRTGIRGSEQIEFQITAPIQLGNSGGPVLDQYGSVIGVIVSKLDALWIAERTGDIPQNVNFAIKIEKVREFLKGNGIQYTTTQKSGLLTTKQAAALASRAVVLVECWK